MSADWTLLAEATRGGLVENQYFGIAVVADAQGRVLRAWGNPQRLVFPRSSLKPLQALPALECGAAAHYGFSREDLALLCASHAGEPRHVERVAAILARLGLDAGALQCGRHLPLCCTDHLEDGTPPLSAFSALHHNCSGKHAGFLAGACHLGAPTASYLAPDHPVQRAVRAAILDTTGAAPGELHQAIDGCSAPTWALPLANLAAAYARLATAPADTAAGRLREAMMAQPELVSGSGRGDAFLMSAAPGEVLAKAGAEGVQAVGLPRLGLGVAVKISDGEPRAAMAACLAVLDGLGVLTDLDAAAVLRWQRPLLFSVAGKPVGELKAVI